MDLSLETALLVFPGLVGLAVYRGVRDRQRDDPAFIQAAFVLGFSLFGGLVAGWLVGFPQSGQPLSGRHLAIALTAVALSAIAVGAAANHEWLYRAGAWLHFTKRAGEHQPWDHVFKNLKNRYVRVRFKDGRVLVGWWRWASFADECHQLFVADAIWYEDDGEHEVLGEGVLIPHMDEVLGIDLVVGQKKAEADE